MHNFIKYNLQDNIEFNETTHARILFGEGKQEVNFTRNEADDQGTYRCEAYNEAGREIREITVTFKGIIFLFIVMKANIKQIIFRHANNKYFVLDTGVCFGCCTDYSYNNFMCQVQQREGIGLF